MESDLGTDPAIFLFSSDPSSQPARMLKLVRFAALPWDAPVQPGLFFIPTEPNL